MDHTYDWKRGSKILGVMNTSMFMEGGMRNLTLFPTAQMVCLEVLEKMQISEIMKYNNNVLLSLKLSSRYLMPYLTRPLCGGSQQRVSISYSEYIG